MRRIWSKVPYLDEAPCHQKKWSKQHMIICYSKASKNFKMQNISQGDDT